MDITQQLRYKVLVERKDCAFFVNLEYENLPEFCSHCLKIVKPLAIVLMMLAFSLYISVI